jgi:hypothetical protein
LTFDYASTPVNIHEPHAPYMVEIVNNLTLIDRARCDPLARASWALMFEPES